MVSDLRNISPNNNKKINNGRETIDGNCCVGENKHIGLRRAVSFWHEEYELIVARSSYFSREAGSQNFYMKFSDIFIMLKDFKMQLGSMKYARNYI